MSDIRKLLKDPFGPYPEGAILSEDAKKVSLKSFYMECGGLPIGFDETEFVATSPSTSRIARNPVEFYGTLEIELLKWLSPQGKEWLQLDLRQRDLELNPQRSASHLTLSSIYGERKNEGSRLLVQIHGVKNLPARFMTQSPPNDFIIHSEKNRMYNVISLDVATFQTSQNFLERYRLWALIDEIIETDPAQTSIEQRTIDWLVDGYLKRFRNRDARRPFSAIPTNAEGTRSRQRFLRHVPRAEITGIFAAHADWLLAQQLASSSNQVKKLNLAKWISFCSQAQVARQQASHRDISWGLPYGDMAAEGLLNLSRFGGDRKFWSKKIKNAQKKTAPRNKQTHRIPSPLNKTALVNQRSPPEFIYDSDFSEASTSAYSDSADEGAALANVAIPMFCLQHPVIPAGRFEWQCPGCGYTIDFLNLTKENTEMLSPADAQHLRGKLWKSLRDECVETMFFAMVNNHYMIHHNSRQMQHVPLRKTNGVRWVKVEEADVIITGRGTHSSGRRLT